MREIPSVKIDLATSIQSGHEPLILTFTRLFFRDATVILFARRVMRS
jgi:hypothetical protein